MLDLVQDFEFQAEWRRQKAIEYPGDSRNAEAAERLDQLAATVKDCPAEVIAAAELGYSNAGSEEWSEHLRQVGFHSWPATAEEFCRDFIADANVRLVKC